MQSILPPPPGTWEIIRTARAWAIGLGIKLEVKQYISIDRLRVRESVMWELRMSYGPRQASLARTYPDVEELAQDLKINHHRMAAEIIVPLIPFEEEKPYVISRS